MLKFTIHMRDGKRSFSEAHYGNFPGSPRSQFTSASSLANARQLALGANCHVDKIVVSTVPANRRVSSFTFQGSTAPTFPLVNGQPANVAEMSNNAPLVQWDGVVLGPPAVDAPPANYYPGGCQDNMFNTSGPDAGQLNKSSTGYATLVTWLNYLSGNPSSLVQQTLWYYRARNPVGIVPATALVLQAAAPNLIGVVTQSQLVDPTAGNAPLQVGQKVNLTGWRVANPRRKNLQGAYKIQSIVTSAGPPATWTYFLWGTANGDITLWQNMGQIGPLLYTFAAYAAYTVEEWVTRKRGGRYGQPVGRSPLRRS